MSQRPAQPEPALIAALKSRDEDRVRELLADGADPNTTAADGRPALSFASRMIETALALIDAGADVTPHVGREFNAVWAASTGRADLVARVLDAGADLNAHTYSGTPLHVAARSGHADVVKLLIDRGADVNAGTLVGNPLADAVERKQTECAVLLLKAGATPKAKQSDGSLLTLAAHHRDARLVDALLAAGVLADERGKVNRVENFEAVDRYANATALMIAARLGDLPIAESLLKAGANPTLRDENGNRPRDLAREQGHADIAARIESALKNFPDASDPNEDLLLAAEKGDAETVKSLLARGADANARDARARSKDATPILLALRKGHAAVVRLLLDAGANPNAVNAVKQPALQAAVDGRNGEAVEALLLAGAKIAGKAGATMLHAAAEAGKVDMVRALTNAGVKADAPGTNRRTPLFAAAGRARLDAIRALLDAGADVNHEDERWATALHAAVQAHPRVTTYRNGQEIVDEGPAPEAVLAAARVLLDAGAEVNGVDQFGFTALGWALHGGHEPLANLLLDRGANPNLGRIADQDMLTLARRGAGAATVARIEQLAAAMPKDAPVRQIETDLKPKRKRSIKPKPEPASAAPEQAKPPEADALPRPLPRPDYSAFLDRADYRQTIAELEKRCGAKARALEHVPGAVYCHVDSRAGFDFDGVRKDFAARGCSVVWLDSIHEQEVALLPTTDPVEVVHAMGTGAPNYDLSNEDIVAWLRALHAEQPFEITAAGHDEIAGRFLGKVKEPQRLARRMYRFCPDIVDQGVGTVAALAKSLKEDRPQLYFWWD